MIVLWGKCVSVAEDRMGGGVIKVKLRLVMVQHVYTGLRCIYFGVM